MRSFPGRPQFHALVSEASYPFWEAKEGRSWGSLVLRIPADYPPPSQGLMLLITTAWETYPSSSWLTVTSAEPLKSVSSNCFIISCKGLWGHKLNAGWWLHRQRHSPVSRRDLSYLMRRCSPTLHSLPRAGSSDWLQRYPALLSFTSNLLFIQSWALLNYKCTPVWSQLILLPPLFPPSFLISVYWSVYYVPGIVLSVRDTVVNKTEKVCAFVDCILMGKKEHQTNIYMYVCIYIHIYISISVQFSCSVMSNSLQCHGLKNARLPCPSPSPGACSNSCPLSRGWHPIISSSVVPFSSCLPYIAL